MLLKNISENLCKKSAPPGSTSLAKAGTKLKNGGVACPGNKLEEKKGLGDPHNEDSVFCVKEDIAKGGVAIPFPWRLHQMLEAVEKEGLQHIVSWQPHGRAFTVRKPKEFVDKILARFFSQTKYPSFQRQLNLYGFSRFAHGKDKGAYFHSCFVRGKHSLVRGMVRRKVKGTKVRRTMSPSDEPNFYDPEWDQKQAQPQTVVRDDAPGTPVLSPEKANPFKKIESFDILEDPDVALFDGKPFFHLDSLEDDKEIAPCGTMFAV